MRFFVVLFIPILMYASYLNDTKKGTFIDIGKTSGFSEVETPLQYISEKPKYNLINSIINKKSRLLQIDSCFEGGFGVESCLKNEILCDNHIEYGSNTTTEHTGAVVDYMKPTSTKLPSKLQEDISTCHGHDLGTGIINTTKITKTGWKNVDYVDIDSVKSCYKKLGQAEIGKQYRRFKIKGESIIKKCLAGYALQKNKKECTKEIKYNYYTYGCLGGYSVADKGLSTCSKTDTDHEARNDTKLAQPCNNKTPSSKNCVNTWQTCPVDSSKECAYKSSYYKIFVPLKKFSFYENSYFKEIEYGKLRGFDCTSEITANGIEKYNCKFGIHSIDATNDGEICFTDMHGFKECIAYQDDSECEIRGSIVSEPSEPIRGLFTDSTHHELLPISSKTTGKLTTNCYFHGKVGYDDVGLGTIAVKADKNRLTFWNSYNSKMVGFLDIIPKVTSLVNGSSVIFFDFEDSDNKTSEDIAQHGTSKEVVSFLKENKTHVNSLSSRALKLFEDSSNIIAVSGGEDMNFNSSTAFNVSFDFVADETPKSDAYIIGNGTQFSVQLTKDRKIKYTLNINDSNFTKTSTAKVQIDTLTPIKLSFANSHINLSIANDIESVSKTGTIGGANSTKITIGSDSNGNKRVDGYIDNIKIGKSEFGSSYDLSFNEHMGALNDEIKDMMDKGFTTVYKSKDNHIYMVHEDKISSTQCQSRLAGTNFYFAVADANLTNFYKCDSNSTANGKANCVGPKQIEVDNIINGYCTDSNFLACVADETSELCNKEKITSDTNSSIYPLLDEIQKACEEKKLIRGISFSSQKYNYTSSGDRLHCVIEGTIANPVDFYNIRYAMARTKNNSANVDKFVCSPFNCNSEHTCGEAVCPKDTDGTLGVDSGFTGCTSQKCDYSKSFFPTCGDYSGCPAGRDIVQTSIDLLSESTIKNVEIKIGGYDDVEARKIREIDINKKKVATLGRGWNMLIFDDNYNLVGSPFHYDTFGNISNATLFKNKLDAISDGKLVVISTYDEPSKHVKDNQALISSMEKFGMSRAVIENMIYRSMYIFVGRKGEAPIIEKYSPRYNEGLFESFNFEDIKKQTKCYKLSCNSPAVLDIDSQTCVKRGCDDKSILKGNKCISTIVK